MHHLAYQAVGEVNGPLLRMLAEEISYHDVGCVDLFRDGAPLVRQFPMVMHKCFRRVPRFRWDFYPQVAMGCRWLRKAC